MNPPLLYGDRNTGVSTQGNARLLLQNNNDNNGGKGKWICCRFFRIFVSQAKAKFNHIYLWLCVREGFISVKNTVIVMLRSDIKSNQRDQKQTTFSGS